MIKIKISDTFFSDIMSNTMLLSGVSNVALNILINDFADMPINNNTIKEMAEIILSNTREEDRIDLNNVREIIALYSVVEWTNQKAVVQNYVHGYLKDTIETEEED